MKDIESSLFEQGDTPESLMDYVGAEIAKTLLRYYPHTSQATAFIGKGHNAGDALVALYHLQNAGWDVQVRTDFPKEDLAPLAQKKLSQLGESLLKKEIQVQPNSILLDGLVGIGAQGALRAPLQGLATEIQTLRDQQDCTVVAIDIPSGVDADTGEITAGAVQADHTLSIGFPKAGILSSSATSHVGAISHLSFRASSEAHAPQNGLQLITPQSLLRKRKAFQTHKGQNGRVAIWAGSEGLLGAAVLTATAALKSGAGLVTAFITPTLYPLLSTMMPPEVMVTPAIDPRILLEQNFDTLIIGPGLGNPVPSLAGRLLFTAENSTVPTIIDADMLNLIAREQKLSTLHANCILTPHPGEMQRLFPSSSELSREETISQFGRETPATILYKGARTLIQQQGSDLYVNSSGSPAMASAGQGDVLSGMIGGFCAQGYSNIEAAKLAAWLAGETAQLALASGQHSEETFSASNTLTFLPQAFAALKRSV